MAYHYYNKGGFTDKLIEDAINGGQHANFPALKKWDILAIDEAQDMTSLYFDFVVRVLEDCAREGFPAPQLCIIGDERQMIYEFKSPPSDTKYLLLADTIFPNPRNLVWRRLQLSTSYRITVTFEQM